MTKAEYMQHLKEALQGYDRSFAEEILESYEEHFADGIKSGRTEETPGDRNGKRSTRSTRSGKRRRRYI